MTVSTPLPSVEEQEQLQQTIEMFEVIVEASPQDCQSLEILKDAYARLGKTTESQNVARRLADTYRDLNQYSLALIEYEGILAQDPNNIEIMAAVGELEEILHKLEGKNAALGANEVAGLGGPVEVEVVEIPTDPGTLIATAHTLHIEEERRTQDAGVGDDANEALGKFLINHRLVTEEAVVAAFERMTIKNSRRDPSSPAVSLLQEISDGGVEMEGLLAGILDRTKFAYIPLEYYEADRAVVKMLPEELALSRLIVPFDVMSRTLMVAMANPLDAKGKELAQEALDYTIQWHLAAPEAITRVLAETYRKSSMESMRLTV